jgi:hypothetical protein
VGVRHPQQGEIRVKKLIGAAPSLALLAVVLVLTVGVGSAASSDTSVCAGGDSGKVDVYGEDATLTITAPDGFVITGYCVKAGSEKQGNGPESYVVDPPATSVVISHSSGKAISHYSYTVEESGDEECPPEDVLCGSASGGE